MTEMLTKEAAKHVAQATISETTEDGPNLRIVDAETIEQPWGWVFFFAASDGATLAGNAPIIVNRHSGEVRCAGTAYAPQHYIDEYEQELQATNEGSRTCAECGSSYHPMFSFMAELCPECSHHLYGYSNCSHTWSDDGCTRCGWNGAQSAHVRELKSKPSS